MDKPIQLLGEQAPSPASVGPAQVSRPASGVAAPRLELPGGGGSISGIGETFAANPVTGTVSMTVPLATSPGRAGFGPQLALTYDSGAGNGPFGLGWSLGLSSITRRTARSLPRYDDDAESDVFMLSGADDLVPVLAPDGSRFEDRLSAPGNLVHRYRPRIEGLFTRIERWTRLADGDVHWRSFSADNVVTIYGQDLRSRIADPADPSHVFSWLTSETRDDRGNAVRYDYKSDDGAGADLAAAHERNRGGHDDPRRQVNRYLKRIRYGNTTPLIDDSGRRPPFLTDTEIEGADWRFEVVLDYGEHDPAIPTPAEAAPWTHRPDAFSSHRPGFEVRTTRRCSRVLMFHHFESEPEVGQDCLVRSTDLSYSDELMQADPRSPIHSFLTSITQRGYRRSTDGYLSRSLPPVEFDYSVPTVQDTVRDVDPVSLENLPAGLAGTHLWTDLHGEGVQGVLTEQAGSWYYTRNLSPISERPVEFAPLELVQVRPNAALTGGPAQLLDLAGNGRPDVVLLGGTAPGFHRHDDAEGWEPFRPFASQLHVDTADPNLRFVDLDGDGHADVLITRDDELVWYPSLAEDGFGAARRMLPAPDEETGPRLVFADGTESIYLADMTGDGLADLIRVRNGEIAYWPNRGYCRFGARVSMDSAPRVDRPDLFDQRRVRLADIDGDGTTDLIYLGADGVTCAFNQSGNAWSALQRIAAFPAVDDLAAIQVADLRGNGTACLVWSSPLPAETGRPMRYIDLMGGTKPHLLIRSANNLGAETVLHYAPSTRFYLADRLAGKPWITRLPFPVQTLERIETLDRISGNRFVSRYAYHHGHFDGVEQEFRGFGLVEQFDTEEFAALTPDGWLADGSNLDASSHVPPVLTRTWFHTGLFDQRHRVSSYFAGTADGADVGEYYREPGLSDAETSDLLLEDTVLPDGLSLDEQREACRALKGSMLRQETYALDGSDREPHPYTVTEQNFTVSTMQPRSGNRHAVFLTHPREAIGYAYERNPDDPHVTHTLTLDVDDYGNILSAAVVGYGRRQPDPDLPAATRDQQAARHITVAANAFTNPVDTGNDYRTPQPSEQSSYELSDPDLGPARVSCDKLRSSIGAAEPISYEEGFDSATAQKRLIEGVRIQYRPDDLGAADGDPLALLHVGRLDPLAVPGEAYEMTFTPGLIGQAYDDRCGDSDLAEAGYVRPEGDPNWWRPSGRAFFSPGAQDDPATELARARGHFFQLRRFRDPFHRVGFETDTVVDYDADDLAVVRTTDAMGNVTMARHDRRVGQPSLLTDPNGNRSEVAFDALGLVVGTAVMGKESEVAGDSLTGFTADLEDAVVLRHLDEPLADPLTILGRATTRTVHDLFAYFRTRDDPQPAPAVAYGLARETHDADLAEGASSRIQHSLVYSDGFGRVLQSKTLAEEGPLTPTGPDVDPRWVGSGWTIVNNKGDPVRDYEPFFSATQRFEFARTEGVSPVLCYDPVGRVVAALHPDHTWDKEVIGGWQQYSWDANDTVLVTDPASDNDVGDHFRRLPEVDYLPGWYTARSGGGLGPLEQAAATQAAVHAGTPSISYADSLGRPVMTVAHNRLKRSDSPPTDPPEERLVRTRVVFDIEGNQREVVDALGRVVIRYDYDMLGSQIHSASMEAGQRWLLADVAGRPRYSWDSRDHRQRLAHDELGRPTTAHLQTGRGPEQLVGRVTYGEDQADATVRNLRGRAHEIFDGAGVATTDAYDFKGNPVRTARRFAVDYKVEPDWSTTVPLESTAFTTTTTVDALDRLVAQTTPDASVTRRGYNQAGLIESIEANLRGETAGGEPVWTPFVTGVAYDAKGQRTRTTFGNGVVTTYDHDPLTFRLTRLQTRRGAESLQDLAYTYDPVGNITHIADAAQQTIFFRNARVEPSNDYLYDATYQLIEASGREHLGQINGQPQSPTAPDAFNLFHSGLEHPGDGAVMGRYLERYVHDDVGNFVEMQHVGSNPRHPGWTRSYTYAEASLIEPGPVSNRLSSTRVGAGAVEEYRYDAHGNMTGMPHLSRMDWDYRDQLRASSRQVVNDGEGETTHYVYDGTGQRARKVTERTAEAGDVPTRKSQRAYLDGFEHYTAYDGSGAPELERETLHVMDGSRRVALVETRTLGDDGSPERLTRYQGGNHLGSVSLELDDTGAIISYEEYSPYGATSYQALNKTIHAAAKRFRYTAGERDEETGLACHGVRYYADWLGRWTSCDPIGVRDGLNVFLYARNRPTSCSDTSGFAGTEAGSNADPLVPKKPSPRQAELEAAGFVVDSEAPPSWPQADDYTVFHAQDPELDYPMWYRVSDDGSIAQTSMWDENRLSLVGKPGGLFALYAVDVLRGGPSMMAEETVNGIAVAGLVKAAFAGFAWGRSLLNFDEIGKAGLQGLQEGAAEGVAEMGPFGRNGVSPDSTIHFIGLGTDAQGGALITLDEISAAAGRAGARFMMADELAELPTSAGRLWLGRYGSGALPGARYPRAGIQLLEGYANSYGGRTGAINLSKVPRAEWFSHIKPLIDNADEVMFHVSTGVGVVDEATGIAYLTSEELSYVLNNPEISSKAIFFYLTTF